jgi:hypothetical protein
MAKNREVFARQPTTTNYGSLQLSTPYKTYGFVRAGFVRLALKSRKLSEPF